jgi:hypothetical protein
VGQHCNSSILETRGQQGLIGLHIVVCGDAGRDAFEVQMILKGINAILYMTDTNRRAA